MKATLETLEADLEDLEESVKYVSFFDTLSLLIINRIVESTDARMFGLDDAEVQRRRRYVSDVHKEIQVRSFLIVQAVATLTSYVSLEHEG